MPGSMPSSSQMMAPRPEPAPEPSAPPAPPPRPGHRLEMALLGAIALVVAVLPERAAQLLGSLLGWVTGSVLRIRRGVVEENLRRAFPERDRRWVRQTARAHYRHLGRESVALLSLPRQDSDAIRARTRVLGSEALEGAGRPGGGALILTGHLGNWELGAASLAVRGVPLDVVARRQSNPLFDARLNRIREALGVKVLPRGAATRPLLRGLRQGRVCALAADQNQRTGGTFVDFFGVPASTMRGPAVLARRTGAPVVLAFCFREPGLRPRYRMELEDLPLPETDDDEAFDAELLRSYLAALETAIRRAPHQYFWGHRRWRTRPPDEVAPT